MLSWFTHAKFAQTLCPHFWFPQQGKSAGSKSKKLCLKLKAIPLQPDHCRHSNAAISPFSSKDSKKASAPWMQNAHDPLTSHVMTSSPWAPPPPLTLTGATLGTKQAQRKLNHRLVWNVRTRQVQRILLKPHSFEWGDHSHSGELLICTKWVHHTAEELGFCWQRHYHSCMVPLLAEHRMSAPCVRRNRKPVPLWFNQRDEITQLICSK